MAECLALSKCNIFALEQAVVLQTFTYTSGCSITVFDCSISILILIWDFITVTSLPQHNNAAALGFTQKR